MFKLNKNTHIMLLFTIAITFVSVYLYYTVMDVKKLNGDVKKINDNVANITTIVTKMNHEINSLKKHHGDVNHHVLEELNKIVGFASEQPSKDEAEENEEDDDSVDSGEIQKILEADDDIEEVGNSEDEEDGKVEDVLENSMEQPVIDVENLKNMKFEELKEICKKHDLSQKGTKAVLIERIEEFCKTT